MSEDLDPLPARGAVLWGIRLPDGRVRGCLDGGDALRMRAVWGELGRDVEVVTCRVIVGSVRTPWRAVRSRAVDRRG